VLHIALATIFANNPTAALGRVSLDPDQADTSDQGDPMPSLAIRHAPTLAAAITLSLAGLAAPSETAYAGTTDPDSHALAPADLSPAGCVIKYVSDPHPSKDPKNRVPVAAKVNAKTECNVPVSWLTLQVTIVDLNTGEKFNSQETAANKDFVFNQSAFLPCLKTATHSYKGFAFGSSTEGGKNYFQYKESRPQPLACSR